MSFGDVYTVNPGDQPLPGPPLNLPSFQAPPTAPVRPVIEVTKPYLPSAAKPAKTESIKDPYAALDDWQPPSAQGSQPGPQGALQGAATAGDPYAALDDWKPSQPIAPAREISAPEAFGKGALEGMTFGAAPALAGLSAAGGTARSGEEQRADELGPTVGDIASPIVGGYKMLRDWAAGHPDPQVRAAYDRGRQSALEDQELAQQQHPAAFLTGQLGAALAMPLGGAARAASTVGRIGRGIVSGGIGGALYGGGEQIGAGGSLGDVAAGAGEGAVTGAAFGGAGAGALEAGAKAGSKVADVIRGARDPETEAARRVLAARQADIESRGGATAFTPEEAQAANQAGTPVAIADLGGERTRALARSAANTSPEARQALTELADARFENQSPRIAKFIRGVTGGADAAGDTAALQAAATRANRPAYAQAYAAGSRPLWSPELERLAGSNALGDAARGAARRANDRAIAGGFGAFNPKVVVKNGLVTIDKKGGVPTHPDLQFWDYVQRELADKANAAARAGRNEEAGATGAIHRQLKAELDRLVPEFRNAREGAARFFGAQDALEAGQKFVMGNANVGEARQALAKMSAPERELFARGFASELAAKIEQTRDRANVLTSVFLDSAAARNKINLALGPQRAGQLEAQLRAETIVDQVRRSLGNSTTARQLAELGLAGGAGALVEGVHSGEISPAAIISGALLFAAAKKGAHRIDQKVARKVGEMLASSDPVVLKRGLGAVTGSPVLFDLLRRATAAGTRVAAHDIGPARTAGAAVAAVDRVFGSEEEPQAAVH